MLFRSFSTPGGSIELLFLILLSCSSTPPRYLSYQRSFSRHLPRQVSQYLSTPAFVEIYCWHYLSSLCDPVFISFDLSLSILLCFLSQTLSSHSLNYSSRFLQAFSSFSSLGKLLILSYSCISCFEA